MPRATLLYLNVTDFSLIQVLPNNPSCNYDMILWAQDCSCFYIASLSLYSTFEELLVKSKDVRFQCSNLQKLMIEIYDCTNHMSPPVLSKFFATEVMKYGSNNRESPPVTKGQISTYGKSSSSFRGSIN